MKWIVLLPCQDLLMGGCEKGIAVNHGNLSRDWELQRGQ